MTAAGAWAAVAASLTCVTYGHLVMKWRLQGRALPDDLIDKLRALLLILFEPWVISAVAATFLGSLLWMAAMTRLPLSQAHPFTAVPLVVVAAASALLLGETLGPQRIAGVALVAVGVALIARS